MERAERAESSVDNGREDVDLLAVAWPEGLVDEDAVDAAAMLDAADDDGCVEREVALNVNTDDGAAVDDNVCCDC